MRLRNIPRADGVIKSHPMVVQDTQESRGNWKNIFGNDRPVYLEIGMGKGRFLMNMAKEHPLVNFVGIERYSSVLLRALEKYDTEEYKELQNIRFLCMDAPEDLPEFLRSMAESKTCQKTADFRDISGSVCEDPASGRKSGI